MLQATTIRALKEFLFEKILIDICQTFIPLVFGRWGDTTIRDAINFRLVKMV